MNEENDALRQEVAELRARLARNEMLLDKTIGALALTSGATEALLRAMSEYYTTKGEGAAYAAGMSTRGVISAMQGAINNLRRELEKSANG